MSEVLRDVRCPHCGVRLAMHIEIRSGWVERKCRKCGETFHAGARRGAGNIIVLQCAGVRRHVIGEASGDWTGSYTTACNSCRPPVETTVERFDRLGPASSRTSASEVAIGA